MDSTESPVPSESTSMQRQSPEPTGAPLDSGATPRLAKVLKCPFPGCPVETNSLQRHLRLVHAVKDAPKTVKRKGKCLLCGRQVSEFTAHVKGFHKINCSTDLYRHIVQLARYGFKETAEPLLESSTSEEDNQDQDMMESFERHLEGLEGGLKSENAAQQHVRHVKQVINDHGTVSYTHLTLPTTSRV